MVIIGDRSLLLLGMNLDHRLVSYQQGPHCTLSLGRSKGHQLRCLSLAWPLLFEGG